MPVMLPRAVICRRRVVSARASSSEIYTPPTAFLHRRNSGLSAISSFRGTGNCFCPGAIRRQNNCSGEVREEGAEGLIRKEQSEHGDIKAKQQAQLIRDIRNSKLVSITLVSDCDTSRNYSKRDMECEDVRVFLFKVAFSVIEHNLD